MTKIPKDGKLVSFRELEGALASLRRSRRAR
jgi:hypothetical protein